MFALITPSQSLPQILAFAALAFLAMAATGFPRFWVVAQDWARGPYPTPQDAGRDWPFAGADAHFRLEKETDAGRGPATVQEQDAALVAMLDARKAAKRATDALKAKRGSR